MRKLDIAPVTLYNRIDFIHAQMVAFEAFKLRKLRAAGWRRKQFALATDAQDHMVNWASRERRIGIQLSTITTADNFTGFIFRTDVNFDPTVGDIVPHFGSLLDQDDFSVVEGLGLSHRYVLPSFYRALGHVLRSKGIAGVPEEKRQQLLTAIESLCPDFDRDGDIVSDNPVRGVLVKKQYTAIAHFMLIAETLPADAELHLMSDPEGAFVSAEPVGFATPLKDGWADLTFVTFNKDLSNPKKKARVEDFKRRLEEFIAAECDPSDDAAAIRRSFIERYAVPLDRSAVGIQAGWWTIPIQTMYEPDKKVGIVNQRTAGTEEEMHQRQLELLDRSSLHAVDSFFNVLRQRVSYFHRAGLSRSSGSFCNAFQPYRPEMVQKLVDIARVYFNWVEPRPFRLAREFQALAPTEFDTSHRRARSAYREQVRRTLREHFSTPAMRMGLAKSPLRLETILYGDWRSKLMATAAPRSPRGRRRTRGILSSQKRSRKEQRQSAVQISAVRQHLS